jgi:hypothetical protein
MNVQSGVVFLEKAQTLTTLEKWEEYAWLIQTREPVVEFTDTTTDVGRGNIVKLPVVPFQ